MLRRIEIRTRNRKRQTDREHCERYKVKERQAVCEKGEVAEMNREQQDNLKDTEKMMGAGWWGREEEGGLCERNSAHMGLCRLVKLKFIQGRMHNPSYFYS